jgi:hypothetical protein
MDVMQYTGAVMAVDPSGRGTDETSFAIIKYLNGYLFLLSVGGFKDGYSDGVLQQLANKAKLYNVHEVVVESNFGDGMFSKLFAPVLNRTHPCTLTEVRHSTQKEARIIDTLEPVMMRHKLIVDKQLIIDDYAVYEMKQQYSLFYQLTRLSRERGSLAHDDRLEAVAMAVSYWVEQMDRDEQRGLDELLDDTLEQWLDPERGIFYVDESGMMPKNPKRQEKGTFNYIKKY